MRRIGFLSCFLLVSTPVFCQVAANSEAAPTYAEVENIIADNCLGCHSSDASLGDVALDSEANVKAFSKQVLAVLKAGIMPPGDVEFGDSANGVAFIRYLESL